MKRIDYDLMDSKYVTIDERGWHIADEAPDELKKQFAQFIKQAEDGVEIEVK